MTFDTQIAAVIGHGGRAKAESELKARETRVDRLTIVPLAAPEAAGFTKAWQALQGRFVDHPSVIENYRAAQATALREQRGEADTVVETTTENLRIALRRYRSFFQRLL